MPTETPVAPSPTTVVNAGNAIVEAVKARQVEMGDNSAQVYKDVLNKDQTPLPAAVPQVITHTTPQATPEATQETKTQVQQALEPKESPAAAAFKELKAKLAEKEKGETEWKSKYEAEVASKKTLPPEYDGKVENVLNELLSTRQTLEPLQKELESYKTKVAEADQIVNTFKVEQSEAYKTNILRPLEKASEDLNNILETNGLTSKDVSKLLAATDAKEFRAQLKALTEDMSAIDASDFRDAVKIVQAKTADKAKVLSEAKQAWDLIEKNNKDSEKQTVQTLQQRAGERATAKNSAVDKYFKDLANVSPAFQEVDGKDEWNNELQTLTIAAKNMDVSRLKPEEEAAMVLQALAYPRAHTIIKSQADRIAQLEKDIAAYSTGVPSIGSNLDRTEEPEKPDTRTPGERMVAAVQKQGIKVGRPNATGHSPY